MKKSNPHRPNCVFKSAVLLAALLGIQNAQAAFTFPVYESFSTYTNSERLRNAGDSGTNWTTGNSLSNTDSPLITTNATMSYPGLLPDTLGNPSLGLYCAAPVGTGRTHGAPFTGQSTNSGTTIYVSFLLSPQTFPSATINGGNRPILGLHGSNVNPPTGTPDPRVGPTVWINSLGQLQISKNPGAALGPPATNATSPLMIGGKYFVVLAYKYNGGSATNDEVDLWVNPTSLGGSAPAPTLAITNGNDTGANIGLNQIGLYSGTGVPLTTNLMDEIRVDTSWAGVTPAGPAPGPIFTVTGGGSGCPGDAFAVGVSGSVATNDYWLYTNSLFSGQVIAGNGSATNFGPQSITGNYNVVASNTVNGNIGWMSGSVAVSVLAGPVITTSPSPVTVATNGTATFSVTATGDALRYQWYRNGVGLADGGHVAGATTPTLTIVPATTADAAITAAGYYVIITNSCSLQAISTTNALTLQPPGNLVWQGGNPNTNWDLATTANFTNSAGSYVKFNAGDNVTLDDSSTNQVVTLVGSLAPTTFTDNASLNYFLNGNGSLAGPATLIMNGPGNLTISNANSYSGGTFINSGNLILRNVAQQALGIGPVTLAGGQLELGLAAGVATAGLSNINVTANSTIQLDVGGTFALNILSQLTGSPGATLTVYDNLDTSVNADRMRLYGNFTNNAQLAITSRGNTLEIAAYHSTGLQVFNGIISGSGGRITARGGGSLVLAAQNIFNDNGGGTYATGSGNSVLLSSGNVGVGADSVPTTYPVSSGPLGTGNLAINVGTEGGTCSLFAYGGARTIANQVIYTSGTNTVTFVISGSNHLTLAGPIQLNGLDNTGNTNRTMQVNNTGLTTFAGVVDDATLNCGLTKTGTNILVLSASNTYTGPTTIGAGTLWVNGSINSPVNVTNGALGGSGSINQTVTVEAAGTLDPGTASIGALTINSNLTLVGNALFKVNKSVSPSNSVANVSGTLSNTGTGTLTVSNFGPALVIGDKFKLFNKAVAGGGALTIAGGGVNWNNTLATDGSIQVLSLISAVASYPTNLTVSVSGSTLNLGWPATHLGWILQSQTNGLNVGLTTPTNAWFDVSGTSGLNATNFTLSPANPAVFYRLRHP